MYTLYGSDHSGSAAIEMALIRCGVEYCVVKASSWEKNTAEEALSRLNPLVQIPTLILPDGSVLTESAAIMIFLGLEYPDAGILSTNASVRSQQLRGLIYIVTNCYASIGMIDYPERWLGSNQKASLKALAEGATHKLYQQWETFSDIFQASAAWCPQAPGGLEMLACVVTRWSGARDYLRTARADFYASLLEIDHYPLINHVVQNHWPSTCSGQQ